MVRAPPTTPMVPRNARGTRPIAQSMTPNTGTGSSPRLPTTVDAALQATTTAVAPPVASTVTIRETRAASAARPTLPYGVNPVSET